MKTAEELYDGAETTEEIVVVDDTKGEPEVEATEDKTEETKTEVKDEPPASSEETQVPLSALTGERDRRQASEAETADLRAQLSESKKVEPTSVFEDEQKQRTEIIEEMKAEFATDANNRSFNQSQFYVGREIGKDVLDQKIEVFKTMVKNNPELHQRMAAAPSPFHELVDIVEQHDELAKMKDLPGYKAQLKAEARAEVKSEFEQEAKDKADLRATIPDSLTGDDSAGGIASKGSFTPPTAKELYD